MEDSPVSVDATAVAERGASAGVPRCAATGSVGRDGEAGCGGGGGGGCRAGGGEGRGWSCRGGGGVGVGFGLEDDACVEGDGWEGGVGVDGADALVFLHPFVVSVGFVGKVVGVVVVEGVVGEGVVAEGVGGEDGVDGGVVAGG